MWIHIYVHLKYHVLLSCIMNLIPGNKFIGKSLLKVKGDLDDKQKRRLTEVCKMAVRLTLGDDQNIEIVSS